MANESARITDAETLGLVLREARLRNEITQHELAYRLNVHQSYVVELEAGKSIKAIDRLFDYASEVGLSLYARPTSHGHD